MTLATSTITCVTRGINFPPEAYVYSLRHVRRLISWRLKLPTLNFRYYTHSSLRRLKRGLTLKSRVNMLL